jgi:chromosome segregation ATPase
MGRIHTEADIRAVCQHLLDTGGERALTRTAVQAALKARAVERGLEPTAADHTAVSGIISAVKAELRAARELAQAAASEDLQDFPLPDGLEPALEQVRRIYRRAMVEEARRSETGTQMRIRQIEAQATEQVATLRVEIEGRERDAEAQALQLDESETALDSVRASLASVSARLEERSVALQTLDRETRGQLSAVHERLQEATAARIASDERAHAAELAREKKASELAVAVERIERLEAEIAVRREAAKDDEKKVREAERARDLAQGRLTAIEEDCAHLRLHLDRPSDARQPSERRSRRTSASKEKAKSAGAG